MRLDKYLADSLSVGRSDVKKLIKAGKVTINGERVSKPEIHVLDSDTVLVNGKKISYQEFYYYMFHKPAGCVTANEDNREKTVFDYLKGIKGKGLSAVGRLDKDTEGLLIITNDGELNHRLMAPGKHVKKTYLCRLAKELMTEDVEKLRTGVDIGDEDVTLPALCCKIILDRANHEIKQDELSLLSDEKDAEPGCLLTITEGRFHQVKRMLKAVGNEVLYLKRISIGELMLDNDLEPGKYRELSESEISKML